MSAPPKHAKFGASSAARWQNCPGSLALIEKAPIPPESAYASEGTTAHSCLEATMTGESTEKFPPEMVEYAREAYEWITEQVALAPGAEVLCETRVDASSFTCADQFGTCDAAVVDLFGELLVIDYKYGAGLVVNPEENLQMIYYALGLSAKYHHNFARVKLAIIQPRAYHESGDAIRTWTVSMEGLLSYIPKFQAGVKAALAPNAPLIPGKHCQFCPAAVICPALKEEAMKKAAIVFDDDTQAVVSTPAPEVIAIPKLGEALTACELLEAWIGKVRAHAVNVLERGGDVKDWKLVQKRSTRKWNDEDAVRVDARLAFGSKAFTTPELLSVAQLEKALGKTAHDWIAERNSSQSSGTTLVHESDKRPPVRHIDAVFEVVD